MKLSEYIDKVMTRIRFPLNKFISAGTNYDFTHKYVHTMCIFGCVPRISLLFIVSNLFQIYQPHHACFASAMGFLFFFFFFTSVIIFLFLIKFLGKFVLKTWISRRRSYFVGIFKSSWRYIFPNCPQVFSVLNLKFWGISKPHKNPFQREESFYKQYRIDIDTRQTQVLRIHGIQRICCFFCLSMYCILP